MKNSIFEEYELVMNEAIEGYKVEINLLYSVHIILNNIKTSIESGVTLETVTDAMAERIKMNVLLKKMIAHFNKRNLPCDQAITKVHQDTLNTNLKILKVLGKISKEIANV